MLKDTGMTMDEFVKTLTPEELVRGKLKDKNGHFTGADPAWVPRAFHRACVAELMRRGKTLWQENYLQAIEVMAEIASGRGAGLLATPGERIKAATFVIERIEGKVPEKLMLVEDKPWQVALDGIVAEVSDNQLVRGAKALAAAQGAVSEIQGDEIEDAEVVDEEYYDDEEEPEPKPSPVRARSRRARR